MNTISKTNRAALISAMAAFALFFFSAFSIGQEVKLKWFDKNPIITPASLPGAEGEDINGPSLIKVPDWIHNKLGNYYLYFAHHKGKYIRLAYANDLEGPWKIYQPGTLQLSETIGSKSPFRNEESVKHAGAENENDEVQHIASPDVHVDETTKEIVLYFHTPLEVKGKKGQYSLRAVSKDGIHFKADTVVLGESYLRVFNWKGTYYALGRSSSFWRSKDGKVAFEKGPNPFNHIQNLSTLRHSALRVVGDSLWVFYSRVGDAPEHILLSKIKLTDDWNQWVPTKPVDIVLPEKDYEGADLPLTQSKGGLYYGKTRELRDPALYVEGNNWYLLYSVAGENGIAIGELNIKPSSGYMK
jgi:hypothetical protein